MPTSTSTTHCLLLFLLCLSLHASHARRLGAVYKKPENKFHLITNKSSTTDQEKGAKVKSLSSKAADEVTKRETMEEETNHRKASIDDLKVMSSRKAKGSSSSGGGIHDVKRSSDSVSWRVPHKKRGVQKQPGFNVDYSPPKTHPPAHN